MNTWILVVVLVGIAGVLLLQLRQARRREAVEQSPPPQSQAIDVAPQIIDRPADQALVPAQPVEPAASSVPIAPTPAIVVATPIAEPRKDAVDVLPAPLVSTTLVSPAPNRRRKPFKKPAPVDAVPATISTTPVSQVLQMLKQTNSLKSAWLLREVFGPPRSRRSHH